MKQRTVSDRYIREKLFQMAAPLKTYFSPHFFGMDNIDIGRGFIHKTFSPMSPIGGLREPGKLLTDEVHPYVPTQSLRPVLKAILSHSI